MQRCLSTPTPALARTARRSVAAAAVPREVRRGFTFFGFSNRAQKKSPAPRAACKPRREPGVCAMRRLKGGAVGRRWWPTRRRLLAGPLLDRLGLGAHVVFSPPLLFSSPGAVGRHQAGCGECVSERAGGVAGVSVGGGEGGQREFSTQTSEPARRPPRRGATSFASIKPVDRP